MALVSIQTSLSLKLHLWVLRVWVFEMKSSLTQYSNKWIFLQSDVLISLHYQFYQRASLEDKSSLFFNWDFLMRELQNDEEISFLPWMFEVVKDKQESHER